MMSEQSARPQSDGYRYYVLAMLCLVYSLNFLDRQLLSIVAEPVKLELGLTDTQLGLLTGLAFALVYTVFGVPVAMLADRTNRVRIVSAACAIWSGFTLMSGFASSFVSLAFARAGVGLGESGGSPPSYSIVADYFPEEKRGLAVAVLTTSVPIGVMLGSLTGGAIASAYGWRNAFIALGILGLVIAPLVLFTVREPKRGQFDRSDIETPKAELKGPGFGFFFRNRIIVLATASASLTTTVGYALLAWGPALLLREKGATLTDLAFYYSFAIGGGLAIGTFGTGILIDRLGKKSLTAYAVVPGVATLFSAPFLAAFALVETWPVAIVMLTAASSLVTSYFTAAMTIIQNEVAPSQRATASALLLFFTNLLGLGCGPLIVGITSDAYADTGHGLIYGILVLIPISMAALLLQVPLFRKLRIKGQWRN